MKLYVCVTKDKYELPLAVADSVRELAQLRGIKTKTITETLSRVKHGSRGWSSYKVVEVDDD